MSERDELIEAGIEAILASHLCTCPNNETGWPRECLRCDVSNVLDAVLPMVLGTFRELADDLQFNAGAMEALPQPIGNPDRGPKSLRVVASVLRAKCAALAASTPEGSQALTDRHANPRIED